MMLELKYTENIDKVFKETKIETDKNLERLQPSLKKDPFQFDQGYRDLNSYIEDVEEMEEERKKRLQFDKEMAP